MEMKLGGEFNSGMEFGNKYIKEAPFPRDYFYVGWEGTVGDKTFKIEFKKITMDEFHELYRHRERDLPRIQGNWETMNIWIKNIWDALYNPVTLMPVNARRRLGIVHGHHRLRLLDAMDVNHFWYYEVSAKVGRRKLPREITDIMQMNDEPPRRGTVSGSCIHCGENTRWKKVTSKSKLTGVKMFCMKCGEENPYPYPGRL